MGRPYHVSAASIFADVVAERRPAPALRWLPGTVTTYDELDRVSDRVARLLMDHGVRRRDTVCIALDRSLAAYSAIIACLKIGAAYCAIDPADPAARTKTLVERCRPAAAIVDHSVDRAPFGCPVIVSTADAVKWVAGLPDRPIDPRPEIRGSDPAYVMFTSGSTGVPKGVTISNANLVNFIHWAGSRYNIGPDDVVTNVNPLFFDNSVFDLCASLFSGASLVPFTAAMLKDPTAVVRRIDELGCTIYFSVPSLLVYLQRLKLIGPGSFPTLKKIIFGGEGYPKPMLAKLFRDLGDRIEFHNVYGPTECTCICSSYRIRAADLADPTGYAPLGALASSFSHVIVDDRGREVAPGEVGELCLGGPCVGLGYYNESELSARAFVQNPTHDRFFDRVYKTGDLVRYDSSDGNLHFVGRADTQIKHQGYRIELGEIEHALASVPRVEEAAVVYVQGSTGGRILAAVAGDADLDGGTIRDQLARMLPRYMIPARVVILDGLPKNANGKVDRRRLISLLDGGGG